MNRPFGAVTRAEAAEVMRRLVAHPRFGPGSQMLVDTRGVTDAPTGAELQELAGHLRPLVDGGLSAVAWVAAPGFVYGVVRMFTAFAEREGLVAEVFGDMPSAMQWLSERRGS